jgi:hypothetical protein
MRASWAGVLGHARDRVRGDDLAAVVADPGGERVGDRLRAPAREGPSMGVPEHLEDQSDRGREGRVEGKDGVGGATGEEGACELTLEPAAGE